MFLLVIHVSHHQTLQGRRGPQGRGLAGRRGGGLSQGPVLALARRRRRRRLRVLELVGEAVGGGRGRLLAAAAAGAGVQHLQQQVVDQDHVLPLHAGQVVHALVAMETGGTTDERRAGAAGVRGGAAT